MIGRITMTKVRDGLHRGSRTMSRTFTGVLIGASTGAYIGIYMKSVIDGLIVGTAELLAVGYSMGLRKRSRTRPTPPRQFE